MIFAMNFKPIPADHPVHAAGKLDRIRYQIQLAEQYDASLAKLKVPPELLDYDYLWDRIETIKKIIEGKTC